MELKGLFPGWISLALAPRRPNWLGIPGAAEKSSISLFINIPVPSIVTPEPKVEFKVYVDDTTFPFLSATEK